MTEKKRDWKPKFLEGYQESGNVAESAKAAGVSRQAAYKARKNSKVFRGQWDEAREELADDLEAVAVSRARKSSDTMLIFLLKGLKPDTYGERKLHGFDQDQPLTVRVVYDGDS